MKPPTPFWAKQADRMSDRFTAPELRFGAEMRNSELAEVVYDDFVR
jgi:hypothetical protein